MSTNEDREKRMAIMAIKENTPQQIEQEIIHLISRGYKLNDLKQSGYAQHLSGQQ